jgi:hypothetical protein
MDLISKTILTVNSKNRLSGTNGNFSYLLPLQPGVKYDYISVLSANIPKTYYLVRACLNSFILSESGTQVTVTVPIGTYSRDSFITSLSTLLSSVSPHHYTYTISAPNTRIGPETGLLTYQCNNAGAIISLIFDLGTSRTTLMHEIMGFLVKSTNTFSGGFLVSTKVTNFSSETCLFLHSDICYNTLSGDNTLQEIFTGGVPYMSYISFTNFTPEINAKKFINHGSVFQFSLTDEDGNNIDLNGVNMVFTLALWKKSHFRDIIEHYVMYKINKNDITTMVEADEDNDVDDD